MVTIGAGGGSIARVEAGTLTVGPQSAGADPGPAAYGRGGAEATVTDAHVVLGHLPAQLLGGRMALDGDAASRRGRPRGRAAARPHPRGGGARHPGDPRQQHGGRDAHRLGRARPRPARFHPGAVRRRRPAAWLLAGRPARHHPRADPAGARRALRRRAAGRRPQGRIQPHPAEGRRGRHRGRAADLRRADAAGRRLARRRKGGDRRPHAGPHRPDALPRPGRRGLGRLGRRRSGQSKRPSRRRIARSTASPSTRRSSS